VNDKSEDMKRISQHLRRIADFRYIADISRSNSGHHSQYTTAQEPAAAYWCNRWVLDEKDVYTLLRLQYLGKLSGPVRIKFEIHWLQK
jgi:hypothetical protein